MKRTFLVISLFVFSFFFPLLSAASRPAQTDSAIQVRSLFSEWDSTQAPGCSVGVIREGQFVFKESFGMADLERNIALQPDSMFYACSVSKQFVAMCILLLEEEGKLELDDNIRAYLPSFPDYGTPLTIRHLLHHTSGIRDYFSLWEMAGYDFQDYMPVDAVYELICRQKALNFTPGEQHMYSNSCYFLLYKIIEKVSGKTLRQYAREHIFVPLGMKRTFFHDDYRRLIPNRALGYYPSPEHGYLNMISRFDLVGSGGMFTCVEDFLPWDSNFYENQLGNKDQALITKMISSGKLNNGKDAGYALALVPGSYKGLEIIEHSGSLGGYRTHYLRFPEQKFSVVILSNLSSFDPKLKTREIADIYLADHLRSQGGGGSEEAGFQPHEENPDPAEKAESVLLTYSEQAEFSGNYYSEELGCAYQVRADKNTLEIKVGHRHEVLLKSMGKGVFNSPFLRISFPVLRPGEPVSFSADSGGARGIKFIKQ